MARLREHTATLPSGASDRRSRHTAAATLAAATGAATLAAATGAAAVAAAATAAAAAASRHAPQSSLK